MEHNDSVGRGTTVFNIFRKSSINLISNGYGAHAIAGGLLAHEIGHNLGMFHDFSTIHGGTGEAETSTNPCNNQGIMSYYSDSDKWSSCSVKDFKDLYNRIKSENNGEWCLTGKHSCVYYKGQCVSVCLSLLKCTNAL